VAASLNHSPFGLHLFAFKPQPTVVHSDKIYDPVNQQLPWLHVPSTDILGKTTVQQHVLVATRLGRPGKND
jgi:hypothetical protein